MKRLHKELFLNWVNTRYVVDKKYPWGFLFSYLGTYPASLFCKFRISANKVTILSLFSLLPGFLLMPNHPLFGWSLFQLWFLLDSTDGHIARFTSTTSQSGYFLDTFGAFIVYSFFFPLLGLSYSIKISYFGSFASIFYILTVLISQFKSSSLSLNSDPSQISSSTISISRNSFIYLASFLVRFSALPFPLALISILTNSVNIYIYFYFFTSLLMFIYTFFKIYVETLSVD